jgi:peptidyl-prolyl cis-trans isomerase D
VETSFGLHLIQVLDRRAGGLRSLEEVQNVVRVRLQGERAQQLAEEKATALSAQIKRDKLTTDEQWKGLLAGADYLTQQKTPAFGREDAVAQLGRIPEFNAAVFAMKPGEISDPVKAPIGWVIARLDEVREPRVPELAEVEAQVRQALQRQKQEQLAVARLTAARGEVAAGKSFDEVATGLGLEVKDSGEFGHGQPITGLGANAELSEAALAAKSGDLGGPVTTRGGAVLFQVTERTTWDPAEFAKNKADTRARLESQQVQRLLAALVETRSRELGVGYNTELLQSLGITPPGSANS